MPRELTDDLFEDDKEWLKGTPFSKWFKRIEALEQWKHDEARILFCNLMDKTDTTNEKLVELEENYKNAVFANRLWTEGKQQRLEEVEQKIDTHAKSTGIQNQMLVDKQLKLEAVMTKLTKLCAKKWNEEGKHDEQFIDILKELSGTPNLPKKTYLNRHGKEQPLKVCGFAYCNHFNLLCEEVSKDDCFKLKECNGWMPMGKTEDPPADDRVDLTLYCKNYSIKRPICDEPKCLFCNLLEWNYKEAKLQK